MPGLNPTCVVSFSSEDPNHPASNLLKKETFRKWKCRDEGEKDAFVIFKLDKAETFTGFSIGNEHSAFIEIFVARSGTDPIKYESIVSQTQLMSPTESRNGDKINGLKIFTSHLLNKVIAAEKWDIVKVVCCQPFNTHVQYGLSFVEFNVLQISVDEKPKIGGFGLRTSLGGSDDEEFDPMPVGSLFSKIKNKSNGVRETGENSPLSTGAAIRQASTSLANAAISSSEAKVKDLLRKRKLDQKSSSEPEHLGPKKLSYESRKGSPKNSSDDPLPKRNTLVDSPLGIKQKNNGSPSVASSSPKGRFFSDAKPNKRNESEGVGSSANSQSSSSGTSRKEADRNNLKQSKASDAKPITSKSRANGKMFSKLFEGVIFVMSGFENPYRTQLRNKALDMGARCKGDWDSTCTHLLCAFVNTPKFREVKSSGKGKIVNKEWVEASYAAKCRFPWRRYCLDRNDKAAESEDEIHAINESESRDDEDILMSSASNTVSTVLSNSTENDEQENERSREMTMTQTRGDSEEGEPQQSSQHRSGEDREDDDVVKKKRKRVKIFDSDEEEVEEYKNKKEHEVEKNEEENDCEAYYDVDTDVDEDKEERFRRTTNDSALEKKSNNEPRNDFFQDCVFLLHPYDSPPLNPTQRDQIEQIISRHKGKVESELTSDLEFVVTESKEWVEDFAEALSENPNLCFVRHQWILDCGKEKQKLSPEPFLILPN